jgi:hypothetical protein
MAREERPCVAKLVSFNPCGQQCKFIIDKLKALNTLKMRLMQDTPYLAWGVLFLPFPTETLWFDMAN